MPASRAACARLAALLALPLMYAAVFVLPVEYKETPGPLGVRMAQGPEALLYSIYGDTTVFGYFMTDIGIGTPPQYFQMLIDTGSSVTHVPSKGCGDRCTAGLSKTYGYDQAASSTAVSVPCGDDCGCSTCRCTSEGVCGYDVRYGGNAASSGNLIFDLFHLSVSPVNVTANVTFGAETEEMGPLQSLPVDGMMGMGQAPGSFINQLSELGVVNASFAMCWQSPINGTSGKSYLLFDQPPPAEALAAAAANGAAASAVGGDALQYTPLKAGETHYYVDLKGLALGEEALDLVPLTGTFSSADDVLVDSGTTYTLMPTKVHAAVKERLVKQLVAKGAKLVSESSTRTCWDHPDFSNLNDAPLLEKYFPRLTYTFVGGASFSAGGENYLFRPAGQSATTACLSIFASSSSGSTPFIVGNTIRQRVLSHYDIQNQRMGFMSVSDCKAVADIWLEREGDGIDS